MGDERRRVTRHDVDHFGLVDCPSTDRRPTLTECSACPRLVGATTDEEGRVIAVRCTAPARSTT